MEKLKEALENSINEHLYQIIVSNNKEKEGADKVKVRPLIKKGRLCFQASSFAGTKVLHSNYEKKDIIIYLMELMGTHFGQLEIETTAYKTIVLVSKKGKVTVKKKKVTAEAKKVDLNHNRVKKYILEEGKPVDFLIDLGVQTKDGYIIKSYYDKFKQINRFLEFIEDILPTLQKAGTVTILDFGCGKSYLTFAMYYYLKVLQKMDIHIIGLDLKEDVIKKCNQLKERYHYSGLEFLQGDIGSYNGVEQVDMVVTLHACDTATDYALQKAVCWKAKVILSVPCCQHELNGQINCEQLEPVLKYGLIKERMSALLTDAIRANLLEANGYEAQILEFIDMEHTPKNILIRAVKREDKMKKELIEEKTAEMDALVEFLRIHPMLKQIL